ncbi:MAG: hypothetical protein ACKO6N_12300, partial [Myxococcota bacterium]
KEAGLKEAGLKEAGLKEAGLKEAGLKEAGLKEAGLKEAGLKGLQKAQLKGPGISAKAEGFRLRMTEGQPLLELPSLPPQSAHWIQLQ